MASTIEMANFAYITAEEFMAECDRPNLPVDLRLMMICFGNVYARTAARLIKEARQELLDAPLKAD
jgi:hypothetical protein